MNLLTANPLDDVNVRMKKSAAVVSVIVVQHRMLVGQWFGNMSVRCRVPSRAPRCPVSAMPCMHVCLYAVHKQAPVMCCTMEMCMMLPVCMLTRGLLISEFGRRREARVQTWPVMVQGQTAWGRTPCTGCGVRRAWDGCGRAWSVCPPLSACVPPAPQYLQQLVVSWPSPIAVPTTLREHMSPGGCLELLHQVIW